MSQFLAAQALIIARLETALTAVQGCKVRPAVDLAYVTENALHLSVSVIFFDDVAEESPVNQFNGYQNQASTQFYLAVISMRNVADIGNQSLLDVGVLADRVLTALQGVALSEQHTPLQRVKCPYRKTSLDGFTHLPFMFTTKIII